MQKPSQNDLLIVKSAQRSAFVVERSVVRCNRLLDRHPDSIKSSLPLCSDEARVLPRWSRQSQLQRQ